MLHGQVFHWFYLPFLGIWMVLGRPQEEAKEVQKAIVSLGPQVMMGLFENTVPSVLCKTPKWPWVKIDVYHLPMKMASWEVFSDTAFPISQLNNAKPNWPLHAFPKRRSLFHWSSQVRYEAALQLTSGPDSDGDMVKSWKSSEIHRRSEPFGWVCSPYYSTGCTLGISGAKKQLAQYLVVTRRPASASDVRILKVCQELKEAERGECFGSNHAQVVVVGWLVGWLFVCLFVCCCCCWWGRWGRWCMRCWWW